MNAKEIYDQAFKENKRLPAFESIILQDVHWTYYYALEVVKSRWEEGEASISTKAQYAYFYARNILKGRWEEGEEIIATNAYYSYHYASYIMKWDKRYKSFYILAIKHLWGVLPEELKNDSDIMTAYFKESILK